jgi:hypothetical protein
MNCLKITFSKNCNLKTIFLNRSQGYVFFYKTQNFTGKHVILKTTLRFYQMLNYVFKNYFLKLQI